MLELSSRNPQTTLFNEAEQLRRDNHMLKEELDSLRQGALALKRLIQMTMVDPADLDEMALLEAIIEASLWSIEASDGSVLLIDEETQELVFAIVSGSIRDRLMGHRLPAGTGIAGWVVANREPVIVPNVNLDPRFSQSVDNRFKFRTQSLVSVPLIYDGRIFGVIQGVNKKHGKTFAQSDVVQLQVVAHFAAWAIAYVEEKIGGEDLF